MVGKGPKNCLVPSTFNPLSGLVTSISKHATDKLNTIIECREIPSAYFLLATVTLCSENLGL